MDSSVHRWGVQIPSQEEQYKIKRQTLIREAGKAFSKKGYHNTSLADLAKVLNVTKTALYYYVKDKNEILFECHCLAIDLGDQALEEASAHSGTPLQKLCHYALRYMQSINRELGNYAVLTEPITSLKEAEREQIQQRRRKHDNVLRGWVRQGIEAGEIDAAEPAVVVAFMMGAINYIPTWFSEKGKVSGDEVADLYAAFIAKALAAAGGGRVP